MVLILGYNRSEISGTHLQSVTLCWLVPHIFFFIIFSLLRLERQRRLNLLHCSVHVSLVHQEGDPRFLASTLLMILWTYFGGVFKRPQLFPARINLKFTQILELNLENKLEARSWKTQLFQIVRSWLPQPTVSRNLKLLKQTLYNCPRQLSYYYFTLLQQKIKSVIYLEITGSENCIFFTDFMQTMVVRYYCRHSSYMLDAWILDNAMHV